MKFALHILFFSFCLLLVFQVKSQSMKSHSLQFSNVSETKDYFRFAGENDLPIISGHRGGAYDTYPENSLPTLEHVLNVTPAIFEIDARMTKDKVAVLMHDKTLDRTTTGTGLLKARTMEELKSLALKTKDGSITDHKIQRLEDAVMWSIGKTIINLDVKNVPLATKAELVKKHKAFHYVIFTVHNAKEAKFFYDYDKRSLFSAFVKTREAFESYEKAGIPWENVAIAYVGSKSLAKNKDLYELLHQNGVKIMVSAAPSYDKLETKEERAAAYRKILKDGANIIESDRPMEVSEAIKDLYPESTHAYKYWKPSRKHN